jgi:two-component system NtrC family sensor kinase
VIKHYAPLPEIECLASQLNQVVMNLVINAAQAIGPERGTITISNGVEGESIWLEVADNGCGIAPDALQNIFDPFFTTKPVGEGTGLGLSLSYGIVKKHHGEISVSSELGKGTTFRVVLPIRQTAV